MFGLGTTIVYISFRLLQLLLISWWSAVGFLRMLLMTVPTFRKKTPPKLRAARLLRFPETQQKTCN